jgi:hypothetical protein
MSGRLDLTASASHVSKFQIVEKSPGFYLNPVTDRVARDALAIEVESARKSLGRVEWDVAAIT